MEATNKQTNNVNFFALSRGEEDGGGGGADVNRSGPAPNNIKCTTARFVRSRRGLIHQK